MENTVTVVFAKLCQCADQDDLAKAQQLLALIKAPEIKKKIVNLLKDGVIPLGHMLLNSSISEERLLEWFKWLLNEGYDPGVTDQGSMHNTTLLEAISKGKFAIVRFLIEIYDPAQHSDYLNQKDKSIGNTPLTFLLKIDNGSIELIEKLLKKGADVNIPEHSGFTPLHLAAFNGLTDCIELFCSYQANLDALAKGFKPWEYFEHLQSSLLKELISKSNEVKPHSTILNMPVFYFESGNPPDHHWSSEMLLKRSTARTVYKFRSEALEKIYSITPENYIRLKIDTISRHPNNNIDKVQYKKLLQLMKSSEDQARENGFIQKLKDQIALSESHRVLIAQGKFVFSHPKCEATQAIYDYIYQELFQYYENVPYALQYLCLNIGLQKSLEEVLSYAKKFFIEFPSKDEIKQIHQEQIINQIKLCLLLQEMERNTGNEKLNGDFEKIIKTIKNDPYARSPEAKLAVVVEILSSKIKDHADPIREDSVSSKLVESDINENKADNNITSKTNIFGQFFKQVGSVANRFFKPNTDNTKIVNTISQILKKIDVVMETSMQKLSIKP